MDIRGISRRHAVFGALGGAFLLPRAARAKLISQPSMPLNPEMLTRIVCIGGAITEILYALGAAGQIAGVDSTSLYPPEAMKEKPVIGYMRAVPPEGVLALKPSLILVSKQAGPPAALELLSNSPIPFIFVDATPSANAVRARVEFLAGLLGRDVDGKALSAKIESGFETLADFRAAHSAHPRVLFVMSAQGGRIMVGGAGTAADAMISLAGGQNAAASINGYAQIGAESLITLAPDAVLAMDHAGPGLPNNMLAGPGFSETRAGKTNSLIRMDGEFLLGFGPRTPQAALDLAKSLAALPA